VVFNADSHYYSHLLDDSALLTPQQSQLIYIRKMQIYNFRVCTNQAKQISSRFSGHLLTAVITRFQLAVYHMTVILFTQ